MDSASGFALFPTPAGRCGIAWTARPTGVRVRAVQLPERDPVATRDRLSRRVPSAREKDPPRGIADLIAAIQDSLDGEIVDLSGAPLDYDGVPRFHRAVYEVTR